VSGEDHTWLDAATITPGAGAPEVDVDVVAGRYRLGALLGRGGSGEVFAADDAVTGDRVAIKFVRALSAVDLRQLRRELTALRLLELPGVVGLRDDGREGGEVFLVMDLLPGGPFSALAGPFTRWAPAARVLVESLARVHHAGVIHRDLKPANVLLDADGRPVITDFGLAQGRAVEHSGGTREGTPRYMPPEQFAGEACDARSDLYALGVMLWELCLDRRFEPADDPRDDVLVAPVPDSVRRIVHRLLDPSPDGRPASAEVVLEALGGGDAVLGPLPPLPDPVTADALESLVEATRPSFLHHAEDFARLLLASSGPRPAAVRATLASWIRAGRCHWSGAKLRTTRAALSALAWSQHPDANDLAARSRTSDDDALAEAALQRSTSAWSAGDAQRAMAVLEQVLPRLDADGPATRVRHALGAQALALNDTAAVRRVLYRAERAGDGPLVALLQGMRSVLRREPERAVQILEPLGGLPAELEIWRLAALGHALAGTHPARHRALLEASAAWCAEDPTRHARWLGWRGQAAYRAGRYLEALEAHEASAAALTAHPIARMTALLNAANAALEAPAFAHAIALADDARALARDLRHPTAESAATALGRTARYRAGHELQPEPAWVDAAAELSRARQAHHAICEAIVAWRRDPGSSVPLATRAAKLYGPAHPVGVLARALVASGGGEVDREALQRDLDGIDDPSIALQTTALAGLQGPVPRWATAWHLPDDVRADVLTLEECLAAT
jgi:serine/threonine-protein kinase